MAENIDLPQLRDDLFGLVLTGLYTGTRPGAILGLHWEPNALGGWVDLERRVMYRRAQAEGDTKKRKTPVRLPSRFVAHLRRWKQLDEARPPRTDENGNPLPRPIVHWHGKPVTKVHKAFREVRGRIAGGNPMNKWRKMDLR